MLRLRTLLALLFLSSSLQAYSVLTHEAIIDTVWDREIKSLLKKRYPLATEIELLRAHASAYGGCIIQDMGYYPFGSTFFSDLVHYVRTGDFVVNQIREAQTLNELAFALGALAHYAADTQGHGLAINPSVALEYPKLAHKFGKSVTYADDKTSHMKVEFSFDVAEVAKGNYAPQAYHDFIGFQVEKGVLQRAFVRTYSLEMKDVFGDLDLALGTYRRAVSTLIPEMTRIAWNLKKDDLAASHQRMTVSKSQFVYNLSRAGYRKEWKESYREPGIVARILAFLMRVLPKVGPLKALAFHPPTAQTLNLFETSFNRTVDEYRGLLAQETAGRLALEDRDFDTGLPTRPTEYSLADNTYAKLARELAKKNTASIDAEMLHDVLEFYRDPNLNYATRKDRKKWRETLSALEKLRAQIGNQGPPAGPVPY
ncbi:MAG: zinc dependent phospholipase C family protein [Candidatus Solibacter sp.]